MDKTITRYTDFDEMKADEYRYWQSRPIHERLDAAAELSVMGYQLKEPTRKFSSDFKELLSAFNEHAATTEEEFSEALESEGFSLRNLPAE